MPTVDLVVRTPVSTSIRARQVQSMFDVPVTSEQERRWSIDIDLDAKPWNVGLIVGPSGAGKSRLAQRLFGEAATHTFQWDGSSVIDDIGKGMSVETITAALSAVGLNTIPAWVRPHAVLSTGEKFRVEIARAILERGDPIVIDEFTSVVDRQVAHVGSHAVQKYVRKSGRKFVAVTCHYDVIDWLQPDWIIEPAEQRMHWRSLQPRPAIECEIKRVPYTAWERFAPYHYLTRHLHSSARCFALHINGEPVAFCGVLPLCHPSVRDIRRISRIVTLPDYQGLGLAFVLADTLGAIAASMGYRFRNYPAHPALIRACDRSAAWRMIKRPGHFSKMTSRRGPNRYRPRYGGRACAVFEYAGPKWPDRKQALAVWG